MLIVNADDLGMTARSTDAILKAHRLGVISSATAMVHCADSERAARLAIAANLPVGLHLNLTQAFTSATVPIAVRERQALAAQRLGANKYARWLPWPTLARVINACITDQLQEFDRLYGAPTHIDGHHHIHISANVLASGALPRDLPMRRSFTFEPGEKSIFNRGFRSIVNRLVTARWQTSVKFFDINDVADNSAAAMRKLNPAKHEVVEVMCHPEMESDWALLTSDAWVSLISHYDFGNYSLLGSGSNSS